MESTYLQTSILVRVLNNLSFKAPPAPLLRHDELGYIAINVLELPNNTIIREIPTIFILKPLLSSYKVTPLKISPLMLSY